ncbi:DUF1848 domain-containing protein [Methanospirillum hungatei]|jgi:hypothetical protein|uniref:DUF1848 domain-containing protein n=1 Tax=Methanospirillum hungatei TaxID=2203 RepID=UPI001B6E3AE4|nr:DUF1848 domain-containing protein [Methanospirillum hungatei]MBP7034833.1 DUF1848 domain-containing protein [Methanospirillum sp.]MBP9008647.1 DUF1848 domain-containing protein [Methanospirillum sp.]HOW04274.1 DUF1848 domain-containing protein [Methanospirillum hungatei]
MAEGKRPLLTDEGIQVSATCPVIISASRATDLPAYYADWFIHRLRRGYVRWVNSFNPHLPYYVSFEDTRAIVFWSRNPLPLFPHLDELDHRGFIYYFQVTLTDYGPEGLEPGVPPLDERISTFIRLSEQIGRDRVIWRFDPVLLTSSLDMDTLLSRIAYIGNRIAPFTNKFVFSFVDTSYSKVKKQAGIWHFRSPDPADKEKFIEGIVRMNRTWGITLASCADEVCYGPEIEQNRCVDDVLLRKIGQHDTALLRYLDNHPGKDPGQRPACRCIKSKDIGQYDTCLHGCVYCYATDHAKAPVQYEKHLSSPEADTITGETFVQQRRIDRDIQSYLL